MITSDTSVFGYLMPAGTSTKLVNLYSRFIDADPSATVVPLATRKECLESAVHNVRTGLIQGMLVDKALYSDISSLVDAVTKEAIVSGVIDTIFADPHTGALVGDCVAVKAITAMTSYIETIKDPLVMLYCDCWETRVVMTALSGRVTMMEVVADPSEAMDSIPTGCVVEYTGNEPSDSEPFDLVVNPPEPFEPAENQHKLAFTVDQPPLSGQAVTFEALRLAYSIGKFRSLSEQICLEAAKTYEKNLLPV